MACVSAERFADPGRGHEERFDDLCLSISIEALRRRRDGETRHSLTRAAANRRGHADDAAIGTAAPDEVTIAPCLAKVGLGAIDVEHARCEAGRDATVAEYRVETVVPESKLSSVVAALRRAHPYEEPAFDVYERVEA